MASDEETRMNHNVDEEEESTVARTACPSELESRQTVEDTVASMDESNSLAREVMEDIRTSQQEINERSPPQNRSLDSENRKKDTDYDVVIKGPLHSSAVKKGTLNDVESGQPIPREQETSRTDEDAMFAEFSSRLRRLEDAVRSKEDTLARKPAAIQQQIIPPQENTRFHVLPPKIQSNNNVEEMLRDEDALRSKEDVLPQKIQNNHNVEEMLRVEDALRSKEDAFATQTSSTQQQAIIPPNAVLLPRIYNSNNNVEELQRVEDALIAKEGSFAMQSAPTQQQDILPENSQYLELASRLQSLEGAILSKKDQLQISDSTMRQPETFFQRQSTLENRLQVLEETLTMKQRSNSPSHRKTTGEEGLTIRQTGNLSNDDVNHAVTPTVASMMQARLQSLEGDIATKKAEGSKMTSLVGDATYQTGQSTEEDEARRPRGDHSNQSDSNIVRPRTTPEIELLPRFRRKRSDGSSSATSSAIVSHSSSVSPGAIRVTNPLGLTNSVPETEAHVGHPSYDTEMARGGDVTPITAFGSDEEIHGELGTTDDQRIIRDAFNGMVEVPAKIWEEEADHNARVCSATCRYLLWAILILMIVAVILCTTLLLPVGKSDSDNNLQSATSVKPESFQPTSVPTTSRPSMTAPSAEPSQAPTSLAWELVDTAIIDGSTFINASDRIIGFARESAIVDISRSEFIQNRSNGELLIAATNQQDYVMVTYFCDEESCRDGFFVERGAFPLLSNITDSHLARLAISSTGNKVAVAACQSYIPCEILFFDLAKRGIVANSREPLVGGTFLPSPGSRLVGLAMNDKGNYLAALGTPTFRVFDINIDGSASNQSSPLPFDIKYEWSPPPWTREESAALAADGDVFAIGTNVIDLSELFFAGLKIHLFDTSGRSTAPAFEVGSPFSLQSENAVALAANGTILAIGYTNSTRHWAQRDLGRVDVYRLEDNEWSQMGQTLYGSGQLEDDFGSSVLLSRDGSILVVGAPRSDLESAVDVGIVTTYRWDGTEWTQFGGTLSSRLLESRFGSSLSMTDDLDLLISSPGLSAKNERYGGSAKLYNLKASPE